MSDEKVYSKNSELPRIYYKYLWLLGQFIQHELLYRQGIRIPEPPELKTQYPDKNPAELINIQRDLYGCKFNWNTGDLIVRYKDNNFDISIEAQEIITNNVSKNPADLLGFDNHGFDFNKACDMAVMNIIKRIINEEKRPL